MARDVLIRLNRLSTTGKVPANAAVRFEPTVLRADADGYILDDYFDAVMVDGEATVTDLPETDLNWAYKVQVRGHGRGAGLKQVYATWYVHLPAGEGTVNFEDLPRIDPKTLTPVNDPDPAWVDAVTAVFSDSVAEAVPTTMVAEAEKTDSPFRSALNAAIGDAPLVVYHGADAWYPRPDTTRPVMWIGTATPGNRRDGDLHLLTSSEPAPWAPDWLDLIGWYDATDAAYATGTATVLTDKSGRGIDLTAAATSSALATTTTALPHQAWNFTGTQWFDSGDIGAGTWRQPVTVYVAASIPTAESNRYIMSGTTPYASIVLNSSRGIAAFQGANLWSPNFTVPADTPVVLAVTFNGNNGTTIELNGTTIAGPANTGSWIPTNYRIGGHYNDTTAFTGTIGEIIIGREVTPDEHANATAYLMDKWGVSA